MIVGYEEMGNLERERHGTTRKQDLSAHVKHLHWDVYIGTGVLISRLQGQVTPVPRNVNVYTSKENKELPSYHSPLP